MRKNTLVGAGFLVAVSLLVAACGAAAAETPGGSPAPGGPLEDRSSSSFVGLSVEEAAARAIEQGRAWRVVREDGVDLVVTDDYLEDRINFTVEDATVTAAATDAEMIEDAPSGIDPGEPNRESSSFVGLSLEEAAARADGQGRAWRVIREDGVDLVVTTDYSEDRLNFTVEDAIVVVAVTDAEIVAAASGDSSCRDAVAVVDDGDVIGLVDLNDDGRDEILAVIDVSGVAEIGVWTRDENCSLHRVTLDGAPAALAVGLTDSVAAGVSCRTGYEDDLYSIELASRDGGAWYAGRIAAYNLEGSELVEAPGEGAEYPGEEAAEVAVLACGDVTYP